MFSCIETFHDEIKRSFGSEAFSNLLDKLDEVSFFVNNISDTRCLLNFWSSIQQANKNGEIILLNFLVRIMQSSIYGF